MQNVLFVINPVSGGSDKSDLIRHIKLRSSQFGISYKIIKTTGTNDVEQVVELIDSFNPDRLIVAGGDGTINMFASLAATKDIDFGIIPSGSANGLATALNINPENALDVALGNHVNPVDIIIINDEIEMLHMADLGLNASLVKRYEEENRRGFLGYAISAIKEFRSFEEEFKVSVKHGDETIQKTTPFVVIANASKYGTGFEINPQANISDGKVEICILKPLSTELILNDLFVNDATQIQKGLFDIYSVSECTIICDKPIDFQSDGEYLGKSDSVNVRVSNHQLSVLLP